MVGRIFVHQQSVTQAGAFVDALDDSGSSPLLLAASQRDFTMVTWKIFGRRGVRWDWRLVKNWIHIYMNAKKMEEIWRNTIFTPPEKLIWDLKHLGLGDEFPF